jgi:RNA polymerase sigma factor (sigma-70 family)
MINIIIGSLFVFGVLAIAGFAIGFGIAYKKERLVLDALSTRVEQVEHELIKDVKNMGVRDLHSTEAGRKLIKQITSDRSSIIFTELSKDMDLEEILQVETKDRLADTLIEEFVDIYKQYLPAIYRFVLNRVDDKTVARDITEETFVSLYESMSLGQGPDADLDLAAWLIETSKNLIKDNRWKSFDHSTELSDVDAQVDKSASPQGRESAKHRLSDSNLITQTQRGDVEAFGELYERYVQAVFGFLYARLNDRVTSEDLTEEVFLRAWRSIDGYREWTIPFAAYLLHISRNVVIEYYQSSGNIGQQVSILRRFLGELRVDRGDLEQARDQLLQDLGDLNLYNLDQSKLRRAMLLSESIND